MLTELNFVYFYKTFALSFMINLESNYINGKNKTNRKKDCSKTTQETTHGYQDCQKISTSSSRSQETPSIQTWHHCSQRNQKVSKKRTYFFI